MNTYIALLRGINVGGHKRIKMADLRALLQQLGFENIATYIQSGNIVFQSQENKSFCATAIKELIRAHYGFEVPVLLLIAKHLKEVLQSCPFSEEKQSDSYYTLLFEPPQNENIAIFKSIHYPDEEIELINDCVYFYTSKGMGKAKYSNNLAENKLKVIATTRNHRTLCKLIEMAKTHA